MNNPTPIFISRKELTNHIVNNLTCCRYNEDIQIIYSNKNNISTTRSRADHIKIWSSWLAPIVTYLPLTIQYKDKNIPIICYHRNT